MARRVRLYLFTAIKYTRAALAMGAKTLTMSCGVQQQRIMTQTENGVTVFAVRDDAAT